MYNKAMRKVGRVVLGKDGRIRLKRAMSAMPKDMRKLTAQRIRRDELAYQKRKLI